MLSLFVILIETEKGLKSDTATAKMRVFQIQGIIRQVFQGKLMSMSTLIKTFQLDQPFHLLMIYIKIDNNEQRILVEGINFIPILV